MKKFHRAHSHGDEQAEKPLVLSLCRHGVQDSWSTKQLIEGNLVTAKNFNIVARGVDPAGVRETAEGTRGIEVTLDEIRKAVFICIHTSNVQFLKQRFGQELVTALQTEGYLLIRDGRECQHIDKNTKHPNRHIADCCKVFFDQLQQSFRRRPASEMVYSEAFDHATTLDQKWHSEKDAKTERKKHRKR